MIAVDLDLVTIPLVWPDIFGRSAPTDVEIGSGKGKFLNEWATAHPERNVLAVERSAKYYRLCCDRASRRGLENVRLIRTTGEDLLYRLLPDESVDSFFVLFPDPWPKKRHHKRRFFTPANLVEMRRALVPGGRLFVKSDHESYSGAIAETLDAATGFTILDPAESFSDLPVTGFEQKYLADGRSIRAFALEKRPSSELPDGCHRTARAMQQKHHE